jgi:hypothetical protein
MKRMKWLAVTLLTLLGIVGMSTPAWAEVSGPLGGPMPAGRVSPGHTDPAWAASYWANQSLSGTPVLQRSEAAVDYDWGSGSPAPGVPADGFSARWTRYFMVSAGTYRFTATSDDGIRVWVDGTLLIDQWSVHSIQTNTADRYLNGDHHLVVVEYFEAAGAAVARLSFAPVAPSITNWRGEYYNNTTLSGDPALIRDDLHVNFNWGMGSPAPGTINADYFSARWTRTVSLLPGSYHFSMTVDDGGRLWVNDHLLIDTWMVQAARTYTGDIYLPGGSVTIRMEYFENNGNAQAVLTWNGELPGPPPPPPSGHEVVVDNTSPGFSRGGSPTGWHVSYEGYGGSILYTRNNDWARANYNWARWYPSLSAGRYEVFVYIPAHFANTTRAKYWVVHAGSYTQVIVNQAAYYNAWVSLGTYWFNESGANYVSLADVTGEAYLSRWVSWDAAKWVPR